MQSPAHRAPRPSRLRIVGILLAVMVGGLATTAIAAEVAPRVLDRQDDRSTVAVDDRASEQPAPTPVEVPTQRSRTPVARPKLELVRNSAVRFEKEPDPPVSPLRKKAEQEAQQEAQERDEAEPPVPITFRIGSFNVLGSQHTVPGGPRDRFPPASVRTPAAAGLVAKHGVDVLGTQELQADQLRGLQSRTGMAAYPGFGWGEAETDNSVLWDPSVFELVDGRQFIIPFMGRPRPQPVVRLRHLATERELYVVNIHASAGDGAYAAERRSGHSTLVDVVNDLRSEGLPVLVTGDMNDRELFYCNVVPAAGLVASNGGTYSGGCRPPPSPLPVDWVVGSGVSWSNYWRDTTPVAREISDHFFISALAHVG